MKEDIARHWRQDEVLGAALVGVFDGSGFKKNGADNL